VTAHPAPGGPPLRVSGLTRRYGGVLAVDHVDLDVPAAAITALIGPNGAGKSTLFGCVTGLERADGGRVLLDGAEVSGLPAHERARRGLAWTFQRLETFTGLTVAENLLVGAENRHGRPLIPGLLGLADARAGESTLLVDTLLDRLGLAEVRDVPVARLPTGTMRLVELGRALATSPSVLLLDEPASGLDDSQTGTLAALLRALAATGLAILLVEHDVDLVTRLADVLAVMADGRLIAHGEPAVVRADPAVRAAYLTAANGR
jgi:branched-chain amino acid transport system ATP-binding protein